VQPERSGDEAAKETLMLTRYRALVIAISIVLSAGVARDAVAREGAAAGAATEQLRTRVERVVAVLEDPQLKAKPAARRAALRTAATDIFDFTEITRRSLGRHWQTASPAEREDLVALMTALLERSYLSRIEQYSGERIVFAGETAEADLATVRTRLVSKGGVETPVDYRLYKVGDRWMVYDVMVEGVSLVANYRAQFNKILQTSSAQGLVERLRAKQE
jgi:phospholipid transport system substrate-binding protein